MKIVQKKAIHCTFLHLFALFCTVSPANSPAQYLHKMATTKLYLDTRNIIPGMDAPVKISLCMHGRTALHSLGIKLSPEYWDARTAKVIKHPQKQYLNAMLSAKKYEWDMAVLELQESGQAKRARSVTDLRNMILQHISPEEYKSDGDLFLNRFKAYADSRETAGTRSVYIQTIARMTAFDRKLETRSFEEIDGRWLAAFEAFLSKTSRSPNARAIHLRNIRAVFNEALDDEITSAYPFRKFKIKHAPTRKRALTVEQLRTLMDYPCEEYQAIYRDMFVLMFYLCGVNAVDLFNAPKNAIINGRFEYTRAKTGKLYSVKLEPEAMAIIDRYRGESHLLNIMDGRANYKDFLHRMNNALKEIGPCRRHGLGGKKERQPLFPDISQYWCRHTWATMAAELDIPKETIAAGLGHGGNSVTDIYIRFDQRKVDEANRRIIDFVTNAIR